MIITRVRWKLGMDLLYSYSGKFPDILYYPGASGVYGST
jgi:hypothetical protein